MPMICAMACQAFDGLGQQVAGGARRHVVEQERHARRVGDQAEVPVQALLRRLVVIRCDDEHAVDAEFAGGAGAFDRFGRRIAAGAGDHRHAAADALHRDLQEFGCLRCSDRRRFAGRTADDHAVAALARMPVEQAPECDEIHVAGLRHGRDQGDEAAAEHQGAHRTGAREPGASRAAARYHRPP